MTYLEINPSREHERQVCTVPTTVCEGDLRETANQQSRERLG